MSYIYYNINPDDKLVGDCTVRAISLLTDQKWEETYVALAAYGFEEHDMPSSNVVWSKYLIDLGYTRKQIPNTCPVCYTVKDFCDDFPIGKYMLSTGSHVVAVIDGNYYDNWNSGDEIPTSYWFKGD